MNAARGCPRAAGVSDFSVRLHYTCHLGPRAANLTVTENTSMDPITLYDKTTLEAAQNADLITSLELNCQSGYVFQQSRYARRHGCSDLVCLCVGMRMDFSSTAGSGSGCNGLRVSHRS